MVQHCLQDKAVEKARCLARAAQPQSGIGGEGVMGSGATVAQVHCKYTDCAEYQYRLEKRYPC